MSYIDALKADIDAKKKELADVLALIEKSKGLMAEVEHMEQILLFATSPTKKTKVKSKRASAWTPERRAAMAEKTKARHAANKAGKPAVKPETKKG